MGGAEMSAEKERSTAAVGWRGSSVRSDGMTSMTSFIMAEGQQVSWTVRSESGGRNERSGRDRLRLISLRRMPAERKRHVCNCAAPVVTRASMNKERETQRDFAGRYIVERALCAWKCD